MSKPDLTAYKSRMDKAVDALKEEFGGLRTGRASAGLLDPVTVEAYGSTAPLNTVAAVSVPEPRMLMVSVWDKGMTVSVEKAIRSAGLGLNPIVDGQTLRIPIPPLTEERRKDLAKLAAKYTEDKKIAVRNVRRDANDEVKQRQKDEGLSEDDIRREQGEVQKLTDQYIAKIEELMKHKEAEIMEV